MIKTIAKQNFRDMSMPRIDKENKAIEVKEYEDEVILTKIEK